jgi:hypothetical protein
VLIVAFMLPTNVRGFIVILMSSPSPQTVPQGSTATYTYNMGTSHPFTDFSLSVSGVSGSFSSNPVTTDGAGSATFSFIADAGSLPGYCPGSYVFTIGVSGGGETTTTGGTLIVTQVGPPLSVSVATDKPTYRIGDKITILLTANRPAEGLVTIIPPSGSPSTFSYYFIGPSYTLSKTLTASSIGHWSVNFQADDFCSGFSSASASFDVTPDTYDVSVSLDGVPAQYSAQLKVDNQPQGTIGGAEIKKLTFKIDTSHTVTVDQYVSGDAGVRYFAQQNTWQVSSAGSHTFSYVTQYLFTVVTDPDGITPVTGGDWFNAGTSVQTNQVPDTVAGSAGTRYAFKGWQVDGVAQSGNGISLTMDKPHKAVAKYETQYQLLIDSPYGDAKGQGYYAAASSAAFSVTTPWGFPVQQIFVRWEGDYTGTQPQGSITMDKPHVIHAVWSTSYIPLIAIVVAAAAVVGVFLFWRRRRGPAPETKPTPAAPGEAGEEATGGIKCENCGAENAADQKFCTNCGEKLTHHRKRHT